MSTCSVNRTTAISRHLALLGKHVGTDGLGASVRCQARVEVLVVDGRTVGRTRGRVEESLGAETRVANLLDGIRAHVRALCARLIKVVKGCALRVGPVIGLLAEASLEERNKLPRAVERASTRVVGAGLRDTNLAGVLDGIGLVDVTLGALIEKGHKRLVAVLIDGRRRELGGAASVIESRDLLTCRCAAVRVAARLVIL